MGSGPVLLGNPILLCFFSGGGGCGPPVPSLDPHMIIVLVDSVMWSFVSNQSLLARILTLFPPFIFSLYPVCYI